jgi:ABC-2 type transport system ATP-binding protein
MSQRLGVATALLGDPGTLILDEPVNGLDPEGIAWIGGLLRRLAAEGRAVLVASHLAELQETADAVVVTGRGRLLAHATTAELTAGGRSLADAYQALTTASTQYRSRPPSRPGTHFAVGRPPERSSR